MCNTLSYSTIPEASPHIYFYIVLHTSYAISRIVSLICTSPYSLTSLITNCKWRFVGPQNFAPVFGLPILVPIAPFNAALDIHSGLHSQEIWGPGLQYPSYREIVNRRFFRWTIKKRGGHFFMRATVRIQRKLSDGMGWRKLRASTVINHQQKSEHHQDWDMIRFITLNIQHRCVSLRIIRLRFRQNKLCHNLITVMLASLQCYEISIRSYSLRFPAALEQFFFVS